MGTRRDLRMESARQHSLTDATAHDRIAIAILIQIGRAIGAVGADRFSISFAKLYSFVISKRITSISEKNSRICSGTAAGHGAVWPFFR